MNYKGLVQYFEDAFSQQAIAYLLFAIPFFAVFWIFCKKKFKKIRIQITKKATRHHFKHDLLYSASTIFIFAVIDTALIYAEKNGFSLLYFDVHKYGWAWLILSIPIMLFIGDTYFYWTHRAIHHPKLYPLFHKVHHESTDPSPLTAFAFHPLEALVENLANFIVPFILPLHFGAIVFLQLFDMLNNVLGHLGYELYPRNWTKIPFLKYKTASTHHNMHHQLFDGNYALYFTWWDKWMGTEFSDYENRHQAIFERAIAKRKIIQVEKTSKKEVIIIEAILADKTYIFNINSETTILEQAIAQNIPLPFSCKRGRCGTCKMKCVDGEVTMKDNKILTENDLAAGYVLCCQSFAVSKIIKLKK